MLWFCNNATCTMGNGVFAVCPKFAMGNISGTHDQKLFCRVSPKKRTTNVGHCFILAHVNMWYSMIKFDIFLYLFAIFN